MPAPTDLNAVFKQRLYEQIGRIAKVIARQAIDSETLKDSLMIELRPTSDQIIVGVPHYWAIYYHDGRGPIRAKPGRWLVYFKDPAEDPRIANGYPVRAADIVRLTREQFMEGLARGQLIVTKSVGPADPHPFFTDGMHSLSGEIGPVAANMLGEMLLAAVLSEKDKAEIRVR